MKIYRLILLLFLIGTTAKAQDLYDMEYLETAVETSCMVCSINRTLQDSIIEFSTAATITEKVLFHNSHVYFFREDRKEAQNILIELTLSATDSQICFLSNYLLGKIYQRSGILPQALQMYKKAIDGITDHTHPYLANSLYLLAGHIYYKKKFRFCLGFLQYIRK